MKPANKNIPLYTSKRKLKNLWQMYQVFPDGLELHLHLFRPLISPFEQIERVEKRPPLVIFDLFRGKLNLIDSFRTLKLDFADFNSHIDITKKAGFVRHFRISPDNPDAFLAAYQRAIANFQSPPDIK